MITTTPHRDILPVGLLAEDDQAILDGGNDQSANDRPMTVPSPPNMLVPPITTAAMAKSKVGSPALAAPLVKREAQITPGNPRSTAARV